MQKTNTKSKFKQHKGIIIAIAVAVFFAVILLAQYITMGVLSAKEAALNAELERLKALEEEYTMTDAELAEYLLQRALEDGYANPDSPYLVEE